MSSDMIDNMQSVDDWFEWSKSKGDSVEYMNRDPIKDLQWEYADVLYSFLGIYTIGVRAFYKDRADLSGIILKYKDGRNLYNRKLLANTYKEYKKLNELGELKSFISKYATIGNVCPTWPGGNEHRGKSHCYDIPDIYFKRHERWYRELVTQNPMAFLSGVIKSKYAIETEEFLKKTNTPDLYEQFLQHVNSVIDERNSLLKSNIVKGRQYWERQQ